MAIVAEMLTSKAPIVKIPKTPEQRHLIETAIEDNILFSMLSLPVRGNSDPFFLYSFFILDLCIYVLPLFSGENGENSTILCSNKKHSEAILTNSHPLLD